MVPLGAASTGKRKMIKRIYSLGSAALGVAVLSACGSTTPVAVDMSNLSTGDTNQVASGGYIWTYTDHNTTPDPSKIVLSDMTTWDYHATIKPLTSNVPQVSLKPEQDTDTTHGNVIHVSGQVPGKIPWSYVSTQAKFSVDPYWPTINKNGLDYTDAMVPAYPAAGVGFGFTPGNAVFDATGGGKYVGIAFDLKVNVAQDVVWVSFPMKTTDLPDPNNDDLFPKSCQYYTSTNNPVDGGSSCFTSYRKGIFSSSSVSGTPTAYNTLAAPNTWRRFCVLYTEVGVPNWANGPTKDLMKALPFDPTAVIKAQWDMFQPADGSDPVSVKFDVSLDNIKLITTEQAKDAENNCDQSALGQAYKSAVTDAS
jgi:hypothetical protein